MQLETLLGIDEGAGSAVGDFRQPGRCGGCGHHGFSYHVPTPGRAAASASIRRAGAGRGRQLAGLPQRIVRLWPACLSLPFLDRQPPLSTLGVSAGVRMGGLFRVCFRDGIRAWARRRTVRRLSSRRHDPIVATSAAVSTSPDHQVRGSSKPSNTGRVLVGTSGWLYPRWRGDFYPRGCAQAASSPMPPAADHGRGQRLVLFAAAAVELPAWREQTPDDFVFAVKGGRFITHMKKLAGSRRRWRTSSRRASWPSAPSSGRSSGSSRRGWASTPSGSPVLRPAAPHHVGRGRARGAPRRQRGGDGRAYMSAEVDRRCGTRWRSDTQLLDGGVRDLLRDHDIAASSPTRRGQWPRQRGGHRGFMYVRLHGAEELYTSGYTDEALDRGPPRSGAGAASTVATYSSTSTTTRRATRRTTRLGSGIWWPPPKPDGPPPSAPVPPRPCDCTGTLGRVPNLPR